MEIVKKTKNGRFLNSLERYHTFRISEDQIQMNDFNADHNTIFKITHQKYPNRW
jgi:hypothetical protein